MRTALAIAAALVVLVPASALATILLMPLWRATEARIGVEAVGHAGPADWCYVVTYAAALLLASLAVWRVRAARRRRPAWPG